MIDGNTEAPRHCGQVRRCLIGGVYIITLPFLLLVLLEVGLRIGGYGISTRFLDRKHCAEGTYHVPNAGFYGQFFGPHVKLRDMEELGLNIPETKLEGAYRIFIFGESVAMSDVPDYAHGFGRMLDVMLKATFPNTRFEVFNVAFSAMNSHVMRLESKACSRLHPDLFLIYMGNNEYTGPFSPAWDFGEKHPSLWAIRAAIQMKSLRTVQIFRNIWWHLNFRFKGKPAISREYTRKSRFDAPEKKRMYDDFRTNLGEMCSHAIGAGAKVLVCSLARNFRDWPPSHSLNDPALSASQMAEFDQAFSDGLAKSEAGDFEAARASLERAAAIDKTYAMADYRLGKVYWELADYGKADQFFRLAVEHEAMQIGSDARINGIVREMADGQYGKEVFHADVAKAFDQASPHGIPGHELIYDPVHLMLEGNHIVACTLFESIIQILPKEIRACAARPLEPLPLVECRRWLALSAPVLKRNLSAIRDDVLSLSDLNPDAETNAAWVQRQNDEVEHGIPTDPAELEIDGYRNALRLNPEDFFLLTRLAKILMERGELQEAKEIAERAVSCCPLSSVARSLRDEVQSKISRERSQ